MHTPHAGIDSLLPHRRPMRLVDEIVAVEGDSVVTAATVIAQWPLLTDGAVSPIVTVELVAQSAAALGGWKHRRHPDLSAGRAGLLVGIQSAVFHIDRIPLHTRMLIRCTSRQMLGDFKQIAGSVHIGDKLIAEIDLRTVQLASP